LSTKIKYHIQHLPGGTYVAEWPIDPWNWHALGRTCLTLRGEKRKIARDKRKAQRGDQEASIVVYEEAYER
jgi:hypothetical protein